MSTKKCLFESNLQLTHTKIKAQRAQLITEDARDAASELIRTLEKEKRNLSKKRMSLEDLSPTSTRSLKVGSDDFNGEKWFEELYEIELKITEVNIKLKLAKELDTKYFSTNG
jgi:malate synthase